MSIRVVEVARKSLRELAWTGGLAALAGCANCYDLLRSRGNPLPEILAAALSILAAIKIAFVVHQAAPVEADGSGSTHLSAGLLRVQEEERKSLSRDLHDGVGQTVTALKMELSRIKPSDGEDASRLDRVRTLAEDALRTIRNVSLLLRPPALDDLGLEAALRWHVEDFSRRTSIKCDLTCALGDDRLLPEPVRTCLYRTVQEALNNCEKHSSAKSVSVRVQTEIEGIRLTVSDDGRGVANSGAGSAGLGILGMRERAAVLGGNIVLDSIEGQGTTLTLFLPAAALRSAEGRNRA